jgi:glycerol-3-phosphate dehydrogenase (NAD(P)+)
MEPLLPVVIIGAGELGRAVGLLLKEKNIEVNLWDIDPKMVPGQKPLQEIIPGAGYICFCVPSWATREAVTRALPYLAPRATVVSFAKGLEKDSLQTMAEMVPTLLPPNQPFMVVGGPMLAAEIMDGRAAVGVFASHNEAVLARVRQVFGSGRFRIETTADVFSVSLAGVLKNIFAVALGIADGLELPGNEKGFLAACAVGEMESIAVTLGADQKIMVGSAGVGDLIATGYSVHSRNRQIGVEIVTTGKCDLRGEGLDSVPPLMQRLGEKAQSFPLLMLIHQIGVVCAPARPAFEHYFKQTD